jgi:type II secretory pathway pseudopilin PulG
VIYYRQTRSGITLIELIVTLTLVMLMAGFGVQVAFQADRIFVRAEIEHLRALIIYLQHKARLERRQHTLTFDLDNNSYTYNGIKYILGHSVVFCKPPVVLHEKQKTTGKNKSSTFKHATVYCYPDGTISAGTIYFAHRQRTRYTNYYALTCGVGHISYVRIYSYTNNSWALINDVN